MPKNQDLLGLGMAALPVVGGIADAFIQSGINKKTRKWNEKMYGIQRRDALADYHAQNLYNSPAAQMARLRDAGLNPNLVYGNGADAQGGTVRSTESKGWSPQAPSISGAAAAGTMGMLSYQDLKIKEATASNLIEQNKVIAQEAALKAAQTMATLTGVDKTKVETATGSFDLALKNAVANYDIAAKGLGVEKLKAEVKSVEAHTALAVTENDVKQAMKAPTVAKVWEEILSLQKDRMLKDSHIDLNSAQGRQIEAHIHKVQYEIDNMIREGALKDFDIMMKNWRGSASDWPGVFKFVQDIIKTATERVVKRQSEPFGPKRKK